ncbi:type II toxin-antitoxin system VapC family toxin [Ellagibacter isourolithinifaciens]|uniref:type II toxin-antitoxin system VapC family toxin n=1 Tax=Ellagibacter isourolithinifaciens TaxID=2137581 RepID=UPI003A9020DF
MHRAPSVLSAKRGKSEVGISEKCLTKSWSGGSPMVVIDANAALEMAFGGERGDALRALLLQGEEAIAPSVFHSEVSNACFKYAAFGSVGEEKAQVLLDRVEALVDCFHDDASLAKEALSESIRYRHPAYDMFYLVLARRTGATLFTLDKKMWALARDMHVNCIEEADLAEATA